MKLERLVMVHFFITILLFQSCGSKEDALGSLSITTTGVTDLTPTTGKSGGNITNDGGSAVTARGVCWSKSHEPTTALTTVTMDGTGSGSFTSSMTGLSAGVWYVRAYATNEKGTQYGNEQTFTVPAPSNAATLTTTQAS